MATKKERLQKLQSQKRYMEKVLSEEEDRGDKRSAKKALVEINKEITEIEKNK